MSGELSDWQTLVQAAYEGEIDDLDDAEAIREGDKEIKRLRADLEVVKAERDAYKNRVNVAVGWMYSEACARMDNGDDIRKAELPEIADRLKSALEHAYPIPTGDKEHG